MPVTAIKDTAVQTWHHSEVQEVTQLLETHQENGLSVQEVTYRQTTYGLNELTGKKGNPL